MTTMQKRAMMRHAFEIAWMVLYLFSPHNEVRSSKVHQS